MARIARDKAGQRLLMTDDLRWVAQQRCENTADQYVCPLTAYCFGFVCRRRRRVRPPRSFSLRCGAKRLGRSAEQVVETLPKSIGIVPSDLRICDIGNVDTQALFETRAILLSAGYPLG